MPSITLPASAANQTDLTAIGKVADPSSFNNWKDYYGTNSLLPDGSKGISTWKAGGVWTDKSVYADSSAFPNSIVMDNQANNFLIALSALASNKEIVGQSSTPTDTMLVLDLSQSMDNDGSVDDMIEAANETIDTLLKMNINNRVGVVLYSGNSSTSTPGYTSSATVILPLDHYTTTTNTTEWEQTNDGWTQVTKYQYLTVSGSNDTTVSVASGTRNSKKQRPTGSKNTIGGTYIQNGLFKAWQEFEDMSDKGIVQSGAQAGTQRKPIFILMSDGRPTLATEDYNNVGTSDSGYGNGSKNSTSWETVFLTQLTAAWVKGAASKRYNTDALFYTIGLGTGNDTYATGVLNPGGTTNNTVSTWWSNFQNGTNQSGSVRVEDNFGNNNDWYLDYDSDRFATGIGKNYVDSYWSADDVDEMIKAFKEIVAEIGLQSAYSATLVESGNADLDGYITVQDELGAMMQVKDVKGILIGDTLFSGAELAKSMNEGLLGTVSNPKDYGDVFVQTVKERIGIDDTSVAQDLISNAYQNKQLNYVSSNDYSNYIGWYGGEDNNYLGFWQESYGYGMEGALEGAKYINKSYGYLGGTAGTTGAADMMHIVVMVRTEITTGHQTVLFKIPASLIPMVEYKVELEGDSLETATNITLTVNENDPIRLVYEVGLPDDVNNININQKVADYLAVNGSNHIHKDEDGNYVFYANGWDNNHDDIAPNISDLTDQQKLDLTEYVAESHFVPNTANERFYIQENSVVYTKNGNSYTPVTNGINANGTYYFARTIITVIAGKAQAVTQYEQLQSATIKNSDNFQRNATTGYWEVKAGTIRQQLSNVILAKDENKTDTIANTDQLWVNINSDDPADYNIYSFFGNNGKLTVTPATGIKVTKDVTELADGASADEKFAIDVVMDGIGLNPVVTDTNGSLLVNGQDYTSALSSGKTVVTLYLADGKSAVISGLPAGLTYGVAEAKHTKYSYTYTGSTQTIAGKIVEGVVTNTPILPGALYITKEVEHANGGEGFPTDHEFEFEVTFKDEAGNPIANTIFQLENNYDENLTELTTDEDGVMTGKLCHGETVYIKGIPAGATVTVKEVNIPANYTKTQYRSRNHSGETADDDGKVTIAPAQNATVVVTNTYTPKPTSVKIDVTAHKTLLSDAPVQSDVILGFEIEKWDAATREWKSVKYLGETWDKDEITQGTATEDFIIDTATLGEFTEVGTYTYRVVEIEPSSTMPGLAYDKTVHTIIVTVTDVNGQLVATVTDENRNPITDSNGDGTLDFTANFTNEFDVAPVSIEIVKTVDNQSNTPQLSKGGFQFVAYEANSNWTLVDDTADYTVTSDSNGSARLTATYNAVGKHYYVVKELHTSKIGWTDFSDAEYHVTVEVAENGAGNLVAEMTIVAAEGTTIEGETASANGNSGTIIFKNTYDPADAEVSLNTLVKKELEGRDMIAGEFTFAIFKNGEAEFDTNGNLTNINKALATGTNDADGNVAFAPNKLTFSKVSKYEFDIIEVKGNKGGVTYDSIIYDLVVEVSDNNGTLEASYYFEDSINKTVTFKNTYIVEPVKVAISGVKTLKVNNGNKTIQAGDYTFGLYNEAGTKIAETVNLANGTFVFEAIEYDIDDIGKTYVYTVKEIAPDGTSDGSYNAGGVTWSSQSFTVRVEITDNGNGTVTANVTGNGANNIEFVNEYNSKPVSVSLPGKKALKDRGLTEGEFKFALYKSDSNFTSRNLIKDDITHNINGNFNINLGTLDMGYYYFVVKEVIPESRDKGIHYDASEYYTTVEVIDNGNGQMSYLTAVKHSGDPNAINPDIAFNNIYQPEPDELSLSGTKTYNGGKALEDDVFSVGLYDDGAELLQTAYVKANGSFTFAALEYTAADLGKIYTYTIKEIIPDGATDNRDGTYRSGNNIYDGTVYTLTVSITDDDKDGALNIESALRKGSATVDNITFTNTFVPNPITHSIEAKKTYNKALNGGDFKFRLVSADDKTDVDQTKENDANGDIIFDSIEFSAAGEYKFKLTEKKDGILSFILPSQAEYEITVTVVNENGVLRVSNVVTENTKNTNETNLEFINTYVIDGEDEVTLRGIKKLTGGRTTVNANEFEFGLYDAAGELIESVKNDADGNFNFTTLKFDETDVAVNGQKQITYTVKEIAGSDSCVTYDETVYTVVVTVKDNEQGGVTASYTVDGEEDGLIEFTNIYTPETEPEIPESDPEHHNPPQTGDNTNINLWLALLFISGGGIFVTKACGRKRKEIKEN